MLNVLITGANGFIASQLIETLQHKVNVIGTARTNKGINQQQMKQFHAVDFDANTNWSDVLQDVDVIVHCAARAHKMNDDASDPVAEYYRINALATENLAQQAQQRGVKRFIFLSSIKVNGEQTTNTVFTAHDVINTENNDGYGLSKYDAEQCLKKIAEQSSMQVISFRLPLVYGPNVKGNLDILTNALAKNIPLPIAAIRHNRRSLLYIGNLISIVEHSLKANLKQSNQVFLVSDGEDISTAKLVSIIKSTMKSQSWLIPLPVFMLKGISMFIAKQQLQRLLSNLQVDIEYTKQQLDWQPPYSVEQALMVSFSKQSFDKSS